MKPTRQPKTIQADARLRAARAAMPVTARLRYLNTGGMGPVSTVFADTVRSVMNEDVARGRAVPERYESLAEAREALRLEIAAIAHADAECIALTQSTRHGLARVIDNFDWRPGDEIVTTDLEHWSCADALRRAAQRHGLQLRIAGKSANGTVQAERLDALMTPSTRLVAVSAVAYETGARLPLEDVVEVAARHGAQTLLDAAQCIGASPLDLPALGFDYCAMPLQKWLCGPEGLGALYARAEHHGRQFVGDRDNVVQGHAIFAGAAAQMRWQRENLGWDWIVTRTCALARRLRDALRELPVRLLTPDGPTGLTTLAFDDRNVERTFAELTERGFIVRQLPGLQALRVSTAYFNSESEIDELVEIIRT